MTHTSILWRRLDQPGHDSALLHEDPVAAVVEGTAVFSEAGRPCRLDYRVVCDATWRTVSGLVKGWQGTTPISVTITVDDSRHWTLNGHVCPQVVGCDDIDLSFSPATNLLPIRRSRLAIGSRVPVRAAWLQFPALVLEPLDQLYERVSESRYRYESRGGSFVAMLETNPAGFVTHYPGLWQVEDAG